MQTKPNKKRFKERYIIITEDLKERDFTEEHEELMKAIYDVVDAAEMAHWVAFDWGDLGFRPIGMLKCVASAIRRESGGNADNTPAV